MNREEEIHKFIFHDHVQNTLNEINNNLMAFNILEITGMGNQEIKHSNILSWAFGDNEHNLGYRFLEIFLKKVAKENNEKELYEYVYLAGNEKDIKIYREKDNIDLLLVDDANDVIIVIENKVFANESDDQLAKYEEKINEKYEEKRKYFLFLTIDLEEPSQENWLKTSYKMIVESTEEILLTKKDISTKTKIILESYVDLLKRRGVVEDKELEKLCKTIWEKEEYKNALETLFNYKPDKEQEIAEYLKQKIEELNEKVIFVKSQKRNTIFIDNRWNVPQNDEGTNAKGGKVVYYEFVNRPDSLNLTISIGPSENQEFREKVFAEAEQGPDNQINNKHQQIFKQVIYKKNIDSLEERKEIIDMKLKEFFKEGGDFDKQYNLLKSLH